MSTKLRILFWAFSLGFYQCLPGFCKFSLFTTATNLQMKFTEELITEYEIKILCQRCNIKIGLPFKV